MKQISLKIENEEIAFAELTNRANLELIAVCKSGNIFLFDFQTGEIRNLGDFKFPIRYSEDLFRYSELTGETKDLLQIHNYKNYACIVQKFGQNGVVFNLDNSEFKKELMRGDYCVEHCTFPIAFYSRQNSTFLIHGTDWNRLDITCLETDELLTDRVVDYETKSNYFDYFHSSLSISLDEKYFTSNGWIWHPYGQITLYSVNDFLKSFEPSHKDINLADDCYSFDWDRPLCWIDKTTLAIGFSKNTEDYGKTEFSDEILFIDIVENKIINRIEFNGFGNTSEGDVFGKLFYDSENLLLIGLNEKKGLFISDVKGKKIFEDQSLITQKYSTKHKLFYLTNYTNQKIEMTKIKTF